MKLNHFIIIVLALCLCMSCEPVEDENHHYSIPFYNGTGATVYVEAGITYPDTLYTMNRESLTSNSVWTKVEPFSTNDQILWQAYGTIENDFKPRKNGYKLIPSDTLMIFVFDAEKIEKGEAPVNDCVLMRYDLSLKDLQKLHWTLSYPPNEAMRDIKMWPKMK